MEKEKTLTDLLTDLELSVHRCRKVYAHETTDRIEAEIESDKQQSTISNLQIKNDKQQRTIRHLRREVRHLRSLLKTKDRQLSAQKTFYEEMNRYSDSRMKEDVNNIESTIKECLERVLINGAFTV
ncbi:MAG: hypothetical protein J6Z01_08795 [Bacteroidales bacterium]|nr:hypothetical protein [Bacteroidales bacterium]